jgi:hypothetical protein
MHINSSRRRASRQKKKLQQLTAAAKGYKSLFVLCLCGGEKCGGSNFRLDWQQDVGATASTLTGIILQNTT